jgi:Protein of unknown function (DUF3570)
VRLQLRLPAAAAVAGLLLAGAQARAEVVTFDTSHTLFQESPTRTKMTVYTPSGDLEVAPFDWLKVRGGWEADVVTGASVATKAGAAYQATHAGADVVTAASVHDFRNQARGGLTLKKEAVELTGNYAFSTENDYRSHAFTIAAKTDTYSHNSQFEISYARNFDRVCDRVQGANDAPPRWHALEDSKGCFASDPLRTTRDLGIDGFQGSWSQSWTPVLVTQLVYTAQILNGFQANPYRSVILGEGLKAQEHQPTNRFREGLAARANFFIKPLKAALRIGVRAYYDTWDVKSGTVEAEFDKYIGDSFRVAARARFYKQSGAIFWSDDYTGGNPPLGPKGQYWTGDRELSPFSSFVLGGRASYTIQPKEGRILGLMEAFKLGASGDVMFFSYDEYTLGGTPVGNARAYILGLAATAIF